MRNVVTRCLLSLIAFLPLSAFADAEMFRPFQPYIAEEFDRRECAANCAQKEVCSGNYKVIREKRSAYWNKQRYYKRHCGSAYINCFYPNEDYPRYNGPGYDLRAYQRKPYYPPFR